MISLAVARSPEEARSLARGIARRMRHRCGKPLREAELEARFGHLCLIAREGECLLESDRIAASKHLVPGHRNFLEEIMEAANPAELGEKLQGLEGFYAGAYTSRDFLILFRDHVGHMPLAYLMGRGGVSAGLERKPLGSGAEQLQPGSMLVVEPGGIRIEKWYSLKPVDAGEAWKLLAERLSRAADAYLPGEFRLAFSGGLDSSLLAHLALGLGRRVKAVTVGVEGCLDLRWASEAAEILGLDIEIVVVGDDELLEAVELVGERIPRRSLMDLAIAAIHYLSARSGAVLVSGQGSDELFGGYWRYEEALMRGGLEEASRRIRRDIEEIHERTLERDEIAVALAGGELLAPYLARPIYELAVAISPELKVRRLADRVVRKWVLRRAAEELGLPEKLLERPKKAAQYSSGILKMLRKLLKEPARASPGGRMG